MTLIDVSHSELLFVFSRSGYCLGMPSGICDDIGIVASFIAKLGFEPCTTMNNAFVSCESSTNNPVLDISIVEEELRYIVSSKDSENLYSLACGPILTDWLEKDKFIELKKIDNPTLSFLFLVSLNKNNSDIYCQFGEDNYLLSERDRILSSYPLFSEPTGKNYHAIIKISDNNNLHHYSYEYPIPSTLKNLKPCRVDEKLWNIFLKRFEKSLVETIDESGAGE